MLLSTDYVDLTLRPMKYPSFFEQYRNGVRNTWSVEEVPFSDDLADLGKLKNQEQHLVKRLVAFFATGDQLVGNNVALSVYRHLNSTEARMYLARQMFEEANHIHFYLTLLDTYVPDHAEREQLFAAVENVPSIQQKAGFCTLYTNNVPSVLDNDTDRSAFIRSLLAYGMCVEGLFFYAAFAYVYFMRSKGLLNALASGTDWVFRDESCHLVFAATVLKELRAQYPHLFNESLAEQMHKIMQEAVRCEVQFARDLLGKGVAGLSISDMTQYIEYAADARLRMFGFEELYGTRNPLTFMDLQDVQELTNFFERRTTAYQVEGDWNPEHIRFDEAF